MENYEQAAEYFKGEESTSSANKCMLKVAQYAAQLEDFDKAIQIYEQVKLIRLKCLAVSHDSVRSNQIFPILVSCMWKPAGGRFIISYITIEIQR